MEKSRKPTSSNKELKDRILAGLKKDGVVILPPMDAFDSLKLLENLDIYSQVNMLDPWYNKGFGGVIEDKEYEKFVVSLFREAGKMSDHMYFWGFPEIVALFMNKWPKDFKLVSWLTWYYKNNPSVIRGWRSAQNACLHLAKEDAKLYPQHFLNDKQLELKEKGKLRYMPGPTSVIEEPLIVGFVGKHEKTGHPSPKPQKLYEKLILMATKEGDLVVDVMAGGGTTGAVTRILNRKSILSDMSEEYTQMMEKRLGISRIKL